MTQRAVFLDRDGTLIQEVNFLSTVEETRLFDETIPALRLLADEGFVLFVTTNQSGIARGYFGAAAVNAIHAKIQDLIAEAGIRIESFHYCPHFPDDGCSCRKPRTGMIDQATHDRTIDLTRSWTIGDKKLDIVLGQNAGTRTGLVLTGYGEEHQNLLEKPADVIGTNILEVAEAIVAS